MLIPLTWLQALLLALCAGAGPSQQAPPPLASPPTQKQIDAAIDNGAKFLLAAYVERVSDGKLAAKERVGLSALSLYTLLKAGISRDDPTLRLMVSHVLDQPIDQTYDATCAILALSAHDAIDNRRWIEELARKLIAWQLEAGDWSYPGGVNDLSNTQYAALGLWVAARDGVPIETSVWTRLAAATLRYQNDLGGFDYSPDAGKGDGGTGSMTAAGIATLAICETALRAQAASSEPLAKKLADARGRGFEWLARNFSVTTNPRAGAWLFYYLYGLERLGALSGVSKIGGHDWYDEGAAWLVGAQTARGSWQNGSDLSDTCFAVLFLKRATSGRHGPRTGLKSASATPDAALELASEGDGVVRVWIETWNPKVARELEWTGERGLGPRVVRVEWLADDKLAAVALGDPAHAAVNENLAFHHIFDAPGAHRVVARAFVLAPGKQPGEEQVFESPPLAIEAARGLPKWAGELAAELGPNLVIGAKAKVKASSRIKVKDAPLGLEYAPGAVLDG
ncbi:MAG: hypothetical protein ABI054_06770, partial [Planctomycetota bacterium]